MAKGKIALMQPADEQPGGSVRYTECSAGPRCADVAKYSPDEEKWMKEEGGTKTKMGPTVKSMFRNSWPTS